MRGQSSSRALQILRPTVGNLGTVFWRPSVSLPGDLPESQVTNYFSLHLRRFLPDLLD